jgi:AraC-like DNA-binding protein
MNRKKSTSVWESDPATIRAFFLTPFIQELQRGRGDSDGFLRKYGFSASKPDRLYDRVPLRQYVALLEAIAKRLERPFLGLDIGQKFTVADTGPFYALFTLVPDVRSALDRLAQFQSTWQTHTSMDVLRGRDTTIYRYGVQDPTIWPRRQDAEYALASMCSLIRDLTTARWTPVEVEFEHDIKDRQARLSRYFRCPVAGGRPSNLMVIANDDLARPLRRHIGSHDAAMLPILERHLIDLLDTPTAGHQNRAQHTALLVARRLGRASVEIDDVAAEMNLSGRSLRRHLEQEGTSFREVLKEQRRSKLEAILKEGDAPLSMLAEALSYSDRAVLSRAFRSWTGTSLRRYSKRRSR